MRRLIVVRAIIGFPSGLVMIWAHGAVCVASTSHCGCFCVSVSMNNPRLGLVWRHRFIMLKGETRSLPVFERRRTRHVIPKNQCFNAINHCLRHAQSLTPTLAVNQRLQTHSLNVFNIFKQHSLTINVFNTLIHSMSSTLSFTQSMSSTFNQSTSSAGPHIHFTHHVRALF